MSTPSTALSVRNVWGYFGWDKVLVSSTGWSGTHCSSLATLDFPVIFLHQPGRCWDYRHKSYAQQKMLTFSLKSKLAGDVVQWQSTYLTCIRAWVHPWLCASSSSYTQYAGILPKSQHLGSGCKRLVVPGHPQLHVKLKSSQDHIKSCLNNNSNINFNQRTYNPRTFEARERGLLWVQDQPELQCETLYDPNGWINLKP